MFGSDYNGFRDEEGGSLAAVEGPVEARRAAEVGSLCCTLAAFREWHWEAAGMRDMACWRNQRSDNLLQDAWD